MKLRPGHDFASAPLTCVQHGQTADNGPAAEAAAATGRHGGSKTPSPDCPGIQIMTVAKL